jgi:hypothetical protein
VSQPRFVRCFETEQEAKDHAEGIRALGYECWVEPREDNGPFCWASVGHLMDVRFTFADGEGRISK